MERLASAIPIRSASSVSVIRRSCNRSSSLTVIAMLYRPFEVFAHERAFCEHAGKQEREQYGEPAVDRKASVYVKRISRSGNGLGDCTNHDAEKVQNEQRPSDP